MSEDLNPSMGPVTEFEGEFVRQQEGKLPAIVIEMPEGYKRHMHLVMQVEVRVRDVNHSEDKKSHELIRAHSLTLEEVRLIDAFHPDARPDNVGGSLSGEDNWKTRLMAFIEGTDDRLEIDESDEMPDRLRALLGFTAPDDARDLESIEAGF